MNATQALATAEWIWCRADAKPNQYAQFIHEFITQATNATLYIAADMNYAVYVNGHYVPGFAFSDYPECRSVDAHDISPYLKNGKNRLCLVGYCQVTTSSTYKEGTPAIRFAVWSEQTCLAASSTSTLSRRSPDYTSGPVECISAQLSYSFHYDARLNDGWLSADYQPGSDWQPAVAGVSQATVASRPIAQLQLSEPCPTNVQAFGSFTDVPNAADLPCGSRMQQAALSFRGRVTAKGQPRRLPSADGITMSVTDGDGLYVLLDLEQETVGLLTLDLCLPQDALILVGFGEHLDDLRVRAEVGGRQYCAVYHGVAGRQTFTHFHKRLGCRYLQLHVYAPSVTLHYAGLSPVYYPLTKAEEAPCNDRLLTAIYQTGIHTLQLCIHEHYEDCPMREQALYAMDSRIQMLCGYHAFHEHQMPRATIDLLGKGLRADGLLEMCAPTCRPRTIPGFSLVFLDCLDDYATYTNDLAFVTEQLPIAATILKTFSAQINPDGFLCHADNKEYWNFYEWSEGLDGSGPSPSPSGVYAPLQAMFILAAEKYLKLCECTGVTAALSDLAEQIARLRVACQRFWHADRKVFVTCLDADLPDSELVQALMLCAGVASPTQHPILLDKLANPETNGLTAITLSHSIYKYHALMSNPERYAAFVANDIARIWGTMLFHGATTFWETEKGAWDFFNAGSLCHGWSAIPVYLLHQYREHLA